MNESYAEKLRQWDEELAGSTPRWVRPKPNNLPLLTWIAPFLLALAYCVYFTAHSVSLRESLKQPHPFLLLFAFILALSFTLYWLYERKVARDWARATGWVERIEEGYRRIPLFHIHYEYQGEFYKSQITRTVDLQEALVGDRVVLLVNPDHPYQCRTYGSLAWRAVSEKTREGSLP